MFGGGGCTDQGQFNDFTVVTMAKVSMVLPYDTVVYYHCADHLTAGLVLTAGY